MTRESIITISDIRQHVFQPEYGNLKDHTDYEAVPQYDLPEDVNQQLLGKPEYIYLDDPLSLANIPEPYDLPLSSSNSSVLSYQTVYQDPGHDKTVIYEWFNKMKFRKIHSSNIK